MRGCAGCTAPAVQAGVCGGAHVSIPSDQYICPSGGCGSLRLDELAMSLRSSVSTVSRVYSRFHWPRAGNLLGSTRPSLWSTQDMLTLDLYAATARNNKHEHKEASTASVPTVCGLVTPTSMRFSQPGCRQLGCTYLSSPHTWLMLLITKPAPCQHVAHVGFDLP
jgi:hypothetical protein